MSRGYLGLGSNVGDRKAHLTAAIAGLRERGVEVESCSWLYDTEPVGLVLDQPDFLNAAIRIDTALEPEPLLDVCKAVEWAVGRTPSGVRHGPRVIDVDLLLLGDRTLRTERLTLPHPEVTTRRFVLVPLLELDPELELPDGTRLTDALGMLGPGQEVRRAAPPIALEREVAEEPTQPQTDADDTRRRGA